MSARENSASVVVGIATRNRAEWLRKAINSALQQSQHRLRIAVIDNASSDETPSLRQEFGSISWGRWEPEGCYVSARNWMMLNANEDYYVSLDDDAWFVEGDEVVVSS